jgi:hypothetical protein
MPSVVTAHDDESLTTGESGRPFQRSLNEARVAGSSDGTASETETKGEGDRRKLHGRKPQTAGGFRDT